MTDEEVIDQFLQELYNSGNKPKSLEPIIKDKERRFRIESTMEGKNLIKEKESTVSGAKFFVIHGVGIRVIEKYGSYSEMIKSEDEINWLNVVLVVLLIIAIIILLALVITIAKRKGDDDSEGDEVSSTEEYY